MSRAATPTALAVTQRANATTIPMVVRRTPRGPWASAFLVTSAMSGPGETTIRREIAMKARKAELKRSP